MDVKGAYRAIVTNNKDPEERGRLLVKCPKLFGDYESAWCLPVSGLAIQQGGQFILPSVGDMVMIMFEDNNENKPLWLGCMWTKNSTGLPEYDPDRYKQVIKTKQGHYILIDDKEDKIMIVHKDKGEIFLEPNEIRVKHNNGNICRVHENGSELLVSSGAGIKIDNGGTVDIIGSTINFRRL